MERDPTRRMLAQLGGVAVAAFVALGLDWPLDMLIPAAMLAGAAVTFGLSIALDA